MSVQQPASQAPVIPIPTRIPIQPIPTHIDLDITPTGDGHQAVCMRIQDPGGVKIVVLSADFAKAFAEQLNNAAVRASVGLVVPSLQLP